MKVLGIVSEYNPFHNGHLFHIERSKAETGCDAVMAVMSGNFVQRGGPAMFDKWVRAACALSCGVDLVAEIPVPFAMASAEYFAGAAVKLLDASGIVDVISFGSEHGDLRLLNDLARMLADGDPAFTAQLKKHLKSGASYITATAKAAAEMMPDLPPDMINSSNNILAVEYLKALYRLGSRIVPFTLRRAVNSYNETFLTGSISSATAIRNYIESQGLKGDFPENIAAALPDASLRLIREDIAAGRGPVTSSAFDIQVVSALRSISAEELSRYPFMNEGLAGRVIKLAASNTSAEAIVRAAATKRYHEARVRRGIFSVLTGVKQADLEAYVAAGGPQYIKVLGFSSKGIEMLRMMGSSSSLPLIIKAADAKSDRTKPVLFRSMLATEAKASDQYVLGYRNRANSDSGQEFTRKIISP